MGQKALPFYLKMSKKVLTFNNTRIEVFQKCLIKNQLKVIIHHKGQII